MFLPSPPPSRRLCPLTLLLSVFEHVLSHKCTSVVKSACIQSLLQSELIVTKSYFQMITWGMLSLKMIRNMPQHESLFINGDDVFSYKAVLVVVWSSMTTFVSSERTFCQQTEVQVPGSSDFSWWFIPRIDVVLGSPNNWYIRRHWIDEILIRVISNIDILLMTSVSLFIILWWKWKNVQNKTISPSSRIREVMEW